MPFQVGNTLGRGRPPAGRSLSEALRVALNEQLPDGRTHFRAIADMMVKRAIDGDIAAAREIWNRIEGPISVAQEDDLNGRREIVIHVLPQDERTL